MRNDPSILNTRVMAPRLRLGGAGRVIAAAGMAAATLFGTAKAQAAAVAPVEFDWSVTSGTGSDGDYTPAPYLTDANVASVVAYLKSEPAGSTLAVKITAPISNATATAIFNAVPVKYVFADFESSTAAAQTQALVGQLQASTQSKSAFVGNFNLYTIPGSGNTVDSTRPTGSTPSAAASFNNVFNDGTYTSTGVNMSNEAAYPGSPDFALPGHGTTAPNIRSALFILPIDRVTYSTDEYALGYYPSGTGSGVTPANIGPGSWANIPWIARFNNWGNTLLDNAPNYQYQGHTYQYAWNTTDPNNPQYANQMLSRGDFSAQVLQYRLRGATSFNLFNYANPVASVINTDGTAYTTAQEQADATAGFNASNITGAGATIPSRASGTLSAIWGRGNYAYANLSNSVPTSPNVVSSSVGTGLVLSGIYDKSGATRELALLLSNMAASAETVDLWQKYGGATVSLGTQGQIAGVNNNTGSLEEYYTIQPGTHQLLQFSLTGGKWVLFADDTVFADSNRNGVGVPEPTSVAVLGLFGASLLLRRKSRGQA